MLQSPPFLLSQLEEVQTGIAAKRCVSCWLYPVWNLGCHSNWCVSRLQSPPFLLSQLEEIQTGIAAKRCVLCQQESTFLILHLNMVLPEIWFCQKSSVWGSGWRLWCWEGPPHCQMTVLAALLHGATAAFLFLWRGGRTVDWGLWSCLAWAVFTVWQLLKSSPQCGSYPAVSKTCCIAECLKNTTLPQWWIAVLSVTSVAKRWWPAGFDPFMQYLYVWFLFLFLSCDHEVHIHAGTFMLVCVDTQS